MIRTIAIAALASIATAILAINLTSGGASDSEDQVAAFGDALTHGTGVDYEPFATPAEARQTADLIVSGRVVDVVDGAELHEIDAEPAGIITPDLPLDGEETLVPLEATPLHFIGLVLELDEVLSGSAEASTRTITVQVIGTTLTTPDDLAELGRDAQIIVGLDAISTSDLTESGLRQTTPVDNLYFPYTDVIWLTSDRGLVSLHAHAELMPEGWADALRSPEALKDALRAER